MDDNPDSNQDMGGFDMGNVSLVLEVISTQYRVRFIPALALLARMSHSTRVVHLPIASDPLPLHPGTDNIEGPCSRLYPQCEHGWPQTC